MSTRSGFRVLGFRVQGFRVRCPPIEPEVFTFFGACMSSATKFCTANLVWYDL